MKYATEEQAREILGWLCEILDADVYERFASHSVALPDGRTLMVRGSDGIPAKRKDGTRTHVLDVYMTDENDPHALSGTPDVVYYRSDGRATWARWSAHGFAKLATIKGGCFDD